MMAAAREWLCAVVAVTLLLAAAQTLIPEGAIRKIASFVGGLILLVTLLWPVLGADLERLNWDLDPYRTAIEDRRAELEAAGGAELEAVIAEETAAYISDKADALGLAVTARVQVRTRDGLPVPWAAELTGRRSEELAAWIEEELGIPRGRQDWHADES